MKIYVFMDYGFKTYSDVEKVVRSYAEYHIDSFLEYQEDDTDIYYESPEGHQIAIEDYMEHLFNMCVEELEFAEDFEFDEDDIFCCTSTEIQRLTHDENGNSVRITYDLNGKYVKSVFL